MRVHQSELSANCNEKIWSNKFVTRDSQYYIIIPIRLDLDNSNLM